MVPVKKTVLDDLLGYINPKPVTVDSEDELEARVVEVQKWYTSSDDDHENVPRKGRKRTLDVSDHDERYAGKKQSRSKMKLETNQEIEVKHSGLEEGISSENDSVVGTEDASDSGSNDISSSSEGDVNSEVEDGEINNSFVHISQQNLGEDAEKGKAVKHQLDMWDSLLECRIKFQKCLIAANSLPQYDIHKKIMCDYSPELKVAAQNTRRSISQLLSKLLELRATVLTSFTETQFLNQDNNGQRRDGKKESDDEVLSSEDENNSVSEQGSLKQNHPNIHSRTGCKMSSRNYNVMLKDVHESYLEYRNATIQKWNDKTRIAVGNLSNKNFSAFEQSTVSQIEQILRDRRRLVQRSQLKRVSYAIIGRDKEEERDAEVFDDGDWYQQLLRELIERKCAGVGGPAQLGQQWLQLQKLRAKMKRKVDTRATKGRKVSYVVHPKLVSFMAPVTSDTWSDSACSELYSSLFSNAASL